jgi:hypothetical protein
MNNYLKPCKEKVEYFIEVEKDVYDPLLQRKMYSTSSNSHKSINILLNSNMF